MIPPAVPMLRPGWRDEAWERLAGPWDVLVVGGGISGAGIARRAARAGLHVLLVEQRDLAWGTSSRSSKLVHGGLRYLREGQVGVVRDSVRERERLLRAAPGLVDELGFLMPTYRGTSPGRWTYTAGLEMYDVLAGRRTHRRLRRSELELLAPRLRPGRADRRLPVRRRADGRRAPDVPGRPRRGGGRRDDPHLRHGGGRAARCGRRHGRRCPRPRRARRGSLRRRPRDRHRERHGRVGGPAARQDWSGAANPAPARLAPGLPGVAIPGCAGGERQPPRRWAARLRVPLGGRHARRDHRRRSPRRSRRRASHLARRGRLPGRRDGRRVPGPRPRPGGRDRVVRGGPAGDRNRSRRPVEGIARPRGLG